MVNSRTMLPALVVCLAPHTSWGLLMPMTSPARGGQQETSCMLRPSMDCAPGLVMQSPRSSDPNEPKRPGVSLGGPVGEGATYISTWFNVVRSCTSRSALKASTSPNNDIGGWFSGGFWNGGGGNGTDSNVPLGDAMEDGGGGEYSRGGVEVRYNQRDGGINSQIANYVPAPNSTRLAPWLWLSALWGLYAVWLRQFPLVTKALTAGVLAFGGDAMAQFFEFQQNGRRGPLLKDTRRLLAVVLDSVLITGPALHTLYGGLEYLIPTAGGGMFPAVCHLMLDTFVFDPMFVASFFCVTGVLENRPLKSDVLPSLRREYWPAVRGAWAVSFFFWPLNYVTFRYLPLELRVLSVNVCDIVWTSVLSYCSHKVVPAATHAVELKIEVTSNMADRGGVFDSLSSALMADAESTGRGIGDGLAGICKWLRNSCRLVLANATF